MSYDPQADPRYVPLPQRGFSDTERDRMEQTAEAYTSALRELDAIADLFDTPGWGYLVTRIGKEQDVLDAELIRETAHERWMFLRGQRLYCDFLVNLPTQINQGHRKLQAELDTLRNQLDNDEEGQS